MSLRYANAWELPGLPGAPEDIADGVIYMVTRPRRASIAELWIMPTDQA